MTSGDYNGADDIHQGIVIYAAGIKKIRSV